LEEITITILYVLLALLMFGVLITIHEFGHFIVARICRVKINEFSIGMGPKIFSRTAKKSGIVYSLRALPVGGYVSMEGESEKSDNENSFYKKPAWQRLLISVAGPIMNILLGFLMTVVLVLTFLDANGDIVMLSTTVGGFQDEARLNPRAWEPKRGVHEG
jgi:regulator of sigma E protease